MNPRTPLERKMRNEVRRLREEEERRALSSMRQGYAYGKRGTLDRMDDYRDQLVDRAGKLLARQTSKVAREMPGPKAHGMREFSRDMIKLLRDERARERAHVSREIDHANREDYRRAKEGMEYNQRKDEAQIVKLTRTVAGTRKSILDELQESLAQLDDLAKGRKRVNTSPFFAVQERGKRQANGISSQGKGDGTARDPIRPSGKNDDANRPAHTFVTQREKQHTDKSFSMDDAYEAMVPWFFGGPTAPRDPGLRQPFQKSTKPNINELVAFNQRTYGFTRLDTLKRLAKSHGFSPESFMFDDLLIKAVPADATAAFGGEKAREKAPPPPPPPNPKDPNVARLESVADRAAGTPTVTPPPPKPASAAAPLPAKPAITGGGTRTQRQTTGMLPHVAAAAAFKEVDPLSDQGHQIMLAHSQSRGWDHGLDETGRMGINTQIGAREAAHSLASLAAAGIVGSYKSPHELEFDNDDHKAEWMASHGLSDASTANIIKTGFEDKGKHIIMVNVHGASGKPEQMMMTFDRNAGGWVPAGGVDAYGRVHNSGDETHEYAKRIGNMLNHYVGDADKFTDQNTLVVNSANARVRNSLHGNMDKNFVNAWSKINTVNNIGQNQADQWHDAAMNRYLAAMNGGKGRMSSPISSPGAAATQTTPQPVQETVQETAQKTGVENVAESPNAPQLTHLAEQYRTANKIKAADKDHINEYYKNISSGNSNITRKEFLQHIIDDPEGMASGSWDDIVSQDEHKGIAGNEELKKHWIALHAAEYKKNAQELLDEENNASAAPDADATPDQPAEATVTPPGADADADPNAQFTNEHKSILSDLAKAKAEKVFVNKDGSLVNKLNVAYPSSLRRGVETNGVSEEWKNSLSDFLRQNNIPDTQEAHDHFMQQYLDHYEKIHNDKFGSGGDAPADAAATTDTDTAPDPDATSGPADLDAINPDTGISLRTYGRIADFEGKKAKKAIIQGKTLDDFLKKFDDPRFGWGTEYSDPATSDKARETYKKESKKAYEDAYAKWHDTLSENNITDEQKSLLSNKAKQQAEGHVDQLTKETSDERSPSVIQSVLQDPRHQNHDASNEKGFYSSFRKVIADPNGIPDTKEAYDHYIQQFLDHYEKAHNDKFGLHNFSPEQLIERHHGQIDESGHGEKTDKVLTHMMDRGDVTPDHWTEITEKNPEAAPYAVRALAKDRSRPFKELAPFIGKMPEGKGRTEALQEVAKRVDAPADVAIAAYPEFEGLTKEQVQAKGASNPNNPVIANILKYFTKDNAGSRIPRSNPRQFARDMIEKMKTGGYQGADGSDMFAEMDPGERLGSRTGEFLGDPKHRRYAQASNENDLQRLAQEKSPNNRLPLASLRAGEYMPKILEHIDKTKAHELHPELAQLKDDPNLQAEFQGALEEHIRDAAKQAGHKRFPNTFPNPNAVSTAASDSDNEELQRLARDHVEAGAITQDGAQAATDALQPDVTDKHRDAIDRQLRFFNTDPHMNSFFLDGDNETSASNVDELWDSLQRDYNLPDTARPYFDQKIKESKQKYVDANTILNNLAWFKQKQPDFLQNDGNKKAYLDLLIKEGQVSDNEDIRTIFNKLWDKQQQSDSRSRQEQSPIEGSERTAVGGPLAGIPPVPTEREGVDPAVRTSATSPEVAAAQGGAGRMAGEADSPEAEAAAAQINELADTVRREAPVLNPGEPAEVNDAAKPEATADSKKAIDPSTFTTEEELKNHISDLTNKLMDRATPEEEKQRLRDQIREAKRMQAEKFSPTIDAGAAEAAATDARIEAQVTRNPQAIKAADELGRVADSTAELSGVVPEAVKNRRQQIEDMADSFAASPEAQAAHKKLLQDIDKGTLSSLQSITRRLNAIAKQHGVTIPSAPVVRRRGSSTAAPATATATAPAATAPAAASPAAASPASETTEERGDDSETPFPDYASKQISSLKNEIGDHPRANAGLQNLLDDIQDGSVSTREALQARIEKIKTDARAAAEPLQELSSAAKKLELTTRQPDNQEYRIEDAPLSPSIKDKFKSLLENPNTAWRVTPPQGRFVNRNGNATSPYTKVESDGGKTRVTLGKIGMKATDAILAALEKQGGLHTQVQQQTHGNTTSFVFPMDKKQTLNFITRTLAAKSRQTGDPISLEHTLSENIYDEDAPIAAGLSGDQAPAPTAAPAAEAAPAPTAAPAAEAAPAPTAAPAAVEARELPDDQKRNVEDILDAALAKASDQEMAGETKSQVLPLLLKYITDSDNTSLNEAVKIWQQHHSNAFPLMGQVRKLNQIKDSFNANKSFASIAQMSFKKTQRLQNEEIAILMNRMYGYGVKQSLSKMRSVF